MRVCRKVASISPTVPAGDWKCTPIGEIESAAVGHFPHLENCPRSSKQLKWLSDDFAMARSAKRPLVVARGPKLGGGGGGALSLTSGLSVIEAYGHRPVYCSQLLGP